MLLDKETLTTDGQYKVLSEHSGNMTLMANSNSRYLDERQLYHMCMHSLFQRVVCLMAESTRENAAAEKCWQRKILKLPGAGCEHSGLAATFKIISQTFAMRKNHQQPKGTRKPKGKTTESVPNRAYA